MRALPHLVALILSAASLLPACGPPTKLDQLPDTTSATCRLTPTTGLKKITINAPGPGGKNVARTYELHVPTGVDASSKVPLLVSLHGTGASGSIQASVAHWAAFADTEAASGRPFISVFPDGLATLWLWGAENSYDAAFVFDVIQEMRLSSCVDATAIYVDGWSEGAYMAQRMACAAGDASLNPFSVAFAGVHGYAGGNPDVSGAGCRNAPPTHVLLSQGLDDTLIDPQRMAFPAYIAWGMRYSCAAATEPLSAAQHMSGCSAGSSVAWWPISDQGHLVWSCTADPTWHNKGVWAYFTQGEAPAGTACG